MVICKQLDKTPDLLALHALKPDDYPFLLASNTSGEQNTRYSMLFSHPLETVIQTDGEQDCLQSIDVDFSQHQSSPYNLPFVGGWFVFLSYEYAQNIEPGVSFFPHKQALPVAFKSRVASAIIVDHQTDQSYIVVEKAHEKLLDLIVNDLENVASQSSTSFKNSSYKEETAEIYLNHINTIKNYIKEGDVFQVNLSRLWEVDFEQQINPLDIYRRLSSANPAPFAALVKIDQHYIFSSSPERLVSVDKCIAETRPIAGTHPRGKTASEDKALSQRLLDHPKEQAEHVMLIDLERNDLGRFCEPGSIKLKDKMVLETYQHVHHIVSSIEGKLKPRTSVAEVLHAVFPGGTITGCPKVRCMEIISELEQTARGVYTGSVGYISHHGRMDFNILIRTFHWKNQQISFRAGAGIVTDSIAEKELMETRHKAKGMLNAVLTEVD